VSRHIDIDSVTVNSFTNEVNSKKYKKILEGKGHIAYIGFHKGIGYFTGPYQRSGL
jgi:hypothetical protein